MMRGEHLAQCLCSVTGSSLHPASGIFLPLSLLPPNFEHQLKELILDGSGVASRVTNHSSLARTDVLPEM